MHPATGGHHHSAGPDGPDQRAHLRRPVLLAGGDPRWGAGSRPHTQLRLTPLEWGLADGCRSGSVDAGVLLALHQGSRRPDGRGIGAAAQKDEWHVSAGVLSCRQSNSAHLRPHDVFT